MAFESLEGTATMVASYFQSLFRLSLVLEFRGQNPFCQLHKLKEHTHSKLAPCGIAPITGVAMVGGGGGEGNPVA